MSKEVVCMKYEDQIKTRKLAEFAETESKEKRDLSIISLADLPETNAKTEERQKKLKFMDIYECE